MDVYSRPDAVLFLTEGRGPKSPAMAMGILVFGIHAKPQSPRPQCIRISPCERNLRVTIAYGPPNWGKDSGFGLRGFALSFARAR